MEKQDFINSVTAIGSCENDVERRELLATLCEEVSKDYDTLLNLSETNTNLLNDNEKLRSANMKLFLRVGEDKNANERNKDETGINNEGEKLSFEKLFNEKGDLK